MTLDHSSICKFHECYIDSDKAYIVMEHIQGKDFDKVVKGYKNKILPEQKCSEYMKVLFQTICHMHAQNVAHRDLKLENIMLTKGNQIKLIDFGLSKRMRD